jgi:methyl-accepting chemotaxis protein
MAAVDQINRGSQQQAAASQQASAALTQIENGAKLQRKNASETNGRVQAMQVALKDGRAAVERMVNGVKTALNGTKESLNTIVQLEAVGRKIEKIVDSIALIAVQTNMLAVSGSVEAARTGIAGRGFAVVSGDIRNLARESSENVDKVKETVRGVLGQIASLRRDLEQSIALVEIEVQNNHSVFAALEKIDADVAALSEANAAILQSSEAIMMAAAETASGARQVAAAAEESSAASRQAATASAQQARGAEDLAAAIEEIASLAEELKNAFPAGGGKVERPNA